MRANSSSHAFANSTDCGVQCLPALLVLPIESGARGNPSSRSKAGTDLSYASSALRFKRPVLSGCCSERVALIIPSEILLALAAERRCLRRFDLIGVLGAALVRGDRGRLVERIRIRSRDWLFSVQNWGFSQIHAQP